MRVIEDFTGSGVVSAAGNRRAFRVGEEPLDMFRRYMAVYCREQAYCHFSPALIANLEKHWNAAQQENLARMPGLKLKGADLTPRRQDLDPIEIASRDEISALQLKRLKWTLAHAYENVAHYKQAFDEAGVHPDDLKTLDDLRKFPFTTKDDLRDNYPFGHDGDAARASCCASTPRPARPASRPWSATAGATSKPGPTSSRAACAPPAAGPACWRRTPTATGCSPAASASTTAPSGWA